MSDQGEETIVAAIMTACVLAVLLATAHLSAASRRIPLAVAVPTLVLLLAELAARRLPGLRDAFRRMDRADVYGIRGIKDRKDRSRAAAGDGSMRRAGERRMMLWSGLLLAMTALGGLLVAVPLFLWAYLRVVARERAVFALTVAASGGLLVYTILAVVLRAPLVDGLLWRWLGV